MSPALGGRYRLDRVLGRGSTGITYAATRLADGVEVAVKEMPLRAGLPGDAAAKARELVEREVRVLRQLHHPQIPAHIDDLLSGAGKNTSFCLVQELVPGEDLARELLVHRFDEDEVLDVLIGILPVFVYLHGLSPPVIHRDVKPRNLMRVPAAEGGRLVLLDFGAVRDAVVDRDLGGSTVAGTFGYMAPEQFRGDAAPATDIYGLGALAVALLTRKEPHTLTDPAGRLAWRSHTRVSRALALVIDRMLDPDPDKRPGSVALLRELTALKARDRTGAADRGAGSNPEAQLGPRLEAGELPRSASPAPLVALAPPELPAVRAGAGVLAPRAPSSRPATVGAAMLGMLLAFGLALAAGGGLLLTLMTAERAPASGPVAGDPSLPVPSPACTIGRPTIPNGRTTSDFAFIAGKPDGSEVALALGRQSDRRAEVIDYEVGSRRAVSEHVLAPADVPGSWADTLAVLRGTNLGALSDRGLDAGVLPTPAAWCQSGDHVQIGDTSWDWRIIEDSCGLLSKNTSFELCPAGSTDESACARPTRLLVGCSAVEPRLVDVFELGDAVWAVAERPGTTTPRFAGGVMTR